MTLTSFERDDTRDYVTIMRCASDADLMGGVLPQLSVWLRQKGFDVNLDESGDYETDNALLVVRRLPDEANIRFQLEEDGGASGAWSTELIADATTPGASWVSIAVRNSQSRFVSVPRLARYLMQALPLGDGKLEYSSGHQLYGIDSVDKVISLLEDEQRHGLVFVAGTELETTIPVDAFAQKVGDWAREVYGLAQVVVLDPHGTADLRRRVGDHYAAPPWAIRTYQPGVRWSDALDARRHRVLGTRSLGSKRDKGIQRLLGDVARQQASTRPADTAVQRLRRRYDRFENRRLVESLQVETPATPVEVITKPESPGPDSTVADSSTRHTDELSLVRRILGVKEITERTLTDFVDKLRRTDFDRRGVRSLEQRVERLQSRVEHLEDQNQQLSDALHDSQLETEVARLDADDAVGRIRWLESRLKDAGDYEASYLEVPDKHRLRRPSTFDELLSRLDEEFKSVEFTGDSSEVARLDQVDTNGSAVRTAWDAVLAMEDYARARAEGACDASLDHYLHHTPAGFQTFPPGKFGETETGRTMKQFGNERVFPVPGEVDRNERVEMKAHFKLARIGMASPRMYIFDGHPTIPKLYIGYIGNHLTNTQSN